MHLLRRLLMGNNRLEPINKHRNCLMDIKKDAFPSPGLCGAQFPRRLSFGRGCVLWKRLESVSTVGLDTRISLSVDATQITPTHLCLSDGIEFQGRSWLYLIIDQCRSSCPCLRR
jgi:hypothetical protein